MYQKKCRRFAVLSLLLVSIAGCGVMHVQKTMTLPSSAFFMADNTELKMLQSLAKVQEARIKACAKSATLCEEAYYTRGLVALFENRADAINVFQEFHTTMPNSRYAASSQRWLYLLQDSPPVSSHNRALLAQLRQEILHSLLDREEVTVGRRSKEQDRKVAELTDR